MRRIFNKKLLTLVDLGRVADKDPLNSAGASDDVWIVEIAVAALVNVKLCELLLNSLVPV